jgi:hypothetical protein
MNLSWKRQWDISNQDLMSMDETTRKFIFVGKLIIKWIDAVCKGGLNASKTDRIIDLCDNYHRGNLPNKISVFK